CSPFLGCSPSRDKFCRGHDRICRACFALPLLCRPFSLQGCGFNDGLFPRALPWALLSLPLWGAKRSDRGANDLIGTEGGERRKGAAQNEAEEDVFGRMMGS